MTLTLTPETEARLLAAATERGLAPEEVIDALLNQGFNHEHPAADAEQERLQGVFDRLHTEALALEIEPALEKLDRTPEEAQVSAIILEKYRTQGFNL